MKNKRNLNTKWLLLQNNQNADTTLLHSHDELTFLDFYTAIMLICIQMWYRVYQIWLIFNICMTWFKGFNKINILLKFLYDIGLSVWSCYKNTNFSVEIQSSWLFFKFPNHQLLQTHFDIQSRLHLACLASDLTHETKGGGRRADLVWMGVCRSSLQTATHF